MTARPRPNPTAKPNGRPRVLIIAEASNPEWVSVPLIGWSLSHALRAVADVHLVTQIRNRDAILRAGLIENKDFTAVDSEVLARPLWAVAERLRMGQGKGWTMVQAISALAYPYFERLVWQEFGTDIRAGAFDLVHRITPLSPTINSPIAARCRAAGVPFVMGPLNGGVPWPPGFDAERRREREWLSYLRGAYKVLPGRRASLAAASAILVGSRHTGTEVPQRFRAKCIYMPENAIDQERFWRDTHPLASADPSSEPGPLRACFIGRMVPYKGPDMLLNAAAPLLRDGRMTLEMIGDGPMLPTLRAQAEALGIAGGVCFHGWLDHRAVQDVAAGCQVLAFPSIREFGGGVVLEAMALGLVPLIVDYAGPGELVDTTTGFKVPLGSRKDMTAAFQGILVRLAADPDALIPMAKAARAKIADSFTWERKAEQMRAVYDWVLSDRTGPPPAFFGDGPDHQSNSTRR